MAPILFPQKQIKDIIINEFANGSPRGWSSQRVAGTTDRVVGGTCGSIHIESFNRNMKTLGVLESKWDPIRKKLVRRLLDECNEQDKVLRSYFAQKGGTRRKGGDRGNCSAREHDQWPDMYA